MNIKGIARDVRLNTAWVNYNCGVRMVGRLVLEGKIDGAWKDLRLAKTDEFGAAREAVAADPEIMKALAREFIGNMQTRESGFVPPLRGADDKHINPVFENDSGKYIPTVLLYADEVHLASKMFPHWGHLVKLFQDDKSLEVEVYPGVAFNNGFYGTSPHFSCVWQIVLPAMRKYVLSNKQVKFDSKQVKNYGFHDKSCSPEHWDQIKSCLAEAI